MTAPTGISRLTVRSTLVGSLRTCCGTGTGRCEGTSRMERITPQLSHASPGLSLTAVSSPLRKSGMRMPCVNAGVASHTIIVTASRAAAPSRRTMIRGVMGLLRQALDEVGRGQERAGRAQPAEPGAIDLRDVAGAVEARQHPV